MENIIQDEQLNRYDIKNIDTLLKGGQIQMLRHFCAIKNEEAIRNIGPIYHLFSKYWTQTLISELKKGNVEAKNNFSDAEIIQKNNPLKYISGEKYNWRGISKSINTLESVRKSVLEKLEKTKG